MTKVFWSAWNNSSVAVLLWFPSIVDKWTSRGKQAIWLLNRFWKSSTLAFSAFTTKTLVAEYPSSFICRLISWTCVKSMERFKASSAGATSEREQQIRSPTNFPSNCAIALWFSSASQSDGDGGWSGEISVETFWSFLMIFSGSGYSSAGSESESKPVNWQEFIEKFKRVYKKKGRRKFGDFQCRTSIPFQRYGIFHHLS